MNGGVANKEEFLERLKDSKRVEIVSIFRKITGILRKHEMDGRLARLSYAVVESGIPKYYTGEFVIVITGKRLTAKLLSDSCYAPAIRNIFYDVFGESSMKTKLAIAETMDGKQYTANFTVFIDD